MIDAASLAVLLARHESMLASSDARLDFLERRLMALELELSIYSGSVGASGGDSDPVVITDAEPNSTR